jgi:hypothetical protein
MPRLRRVRRDALHHFAHHAAQRLPAEQGERVRVHRQDRRIGVVRLVRHQIPLDDQGLEQAKGRFAILRVQRLIVVFRQLFARGERFFPCLIAVHTFDLQPPLDTIRLALHLTGQRVRPELDGEGVDLAGEREGDAFRELTDPSW